MRYMETMRATGLSRISRNFVRLSALGVALVAAQPALATEKLAVNASNVALKVDGRGHAVVYYTKAGRRHHPVVWGAINARHPSAYPTPQVSFKIDYSGGSERLGYPLWKTIVNRCRAYDGPRLPRLVKACKAPDGSYWALQAFQRLLPNYGVKPWLAYQNDWELHISHWSGEVAKLEVRQDWVYGANYREVFGRLTYKGVGVHGFRATSTGVPLDGYGRLIYVDTYNSAYGSGWKRENSFLARPPNGHYCYSFQPHVRPSNYPDGPTRPAGHGQRYRIIAGGPGVTPFVGWSGAALGRYTGSAEDADHEAAMDALKRTLFPDTTKCSFS
jgi:hypothetical protein